jgi:drug/metabolite transporter (DMT)-like permease
VALISKLWLRDPVPRYTVPALSLSLLGCTMMLASDLFGTDELNVTENAIGMALALVSCFFLAAHLTYTRYLGKQGIVGGDIYVSQFILTMLTAPLISLAVGEDWNDWVTAVTFPVGWLLLAACVFVFVIGNITQQHAINALKSATLVSAVQPWRLIVTLVLGFALLGETLRSWLQIVGMLIVILTLCCYLTMQINKNWSFAALWQWLARKCNCRRPNQ